HFFCVLSRGCGRYFSGLPVSGFKGLLPCQCKTQCVLRIWQKLYARFRDRLGRYPESMVYGYGIGSGWEKVVSDFGAGRRNFKLSVRIWGIRIRSSPGLVGVFMTGKEKGVDKEISKKQVRKQI
ncbi:MAG: hypothetical protein IJ733_18235, partial [Lachnospiraceae bacterium]|nr:hypothetical protein [Lachnospiraceae bacterium]